MSDREERLRQFDELVYSGTHGIKGVGWPTKTWGMIKTFDEVHKLYEKIMERPVWTHEMGSDGLKHMRKELLGEEEWLGPIGSALQAVDEAQGNQK